MAVRYIYWD